MILIVNSMSYLLFSANSLPKIGLLEGESELAIE